MHQIFIGEDKNQKLFQPFFAVMQPYQKLTIGTICKVKCGEVEIEKKIVSGFSKCKLKNMPEHLFLLSQGETPKESIAKIESFYNRKGIDINQKDFHWLILGPVDHPIY